MRRMCLVLGLLVVLNAPWTLGQARAQNRTVARCGAGWLDQVDGYRVLHVAGSPYEMGYQQGVLLRDEVHALVRYLFDVKAIEFNEDLVFEPIAGIKIRGDARKIIDLITRIQKKHVPERFYDEMRGLADGAGLPLEEIVHANFIPELFHCSGFALTGKATSDGILYHGRVLDYGTDWRLQEHAVLVVARPDGGIPFVNVTYAGFVGSVTGMNARQVAIGEMGGDGAGLWDGTPMAFLVRMVLEEADDLDEAIAVFRDRKRTCEYFFVISDGKSGTAVGMEASHRNFQVIPMGESEERLPRPLADTVLLSAGDRYNLLVDRVEAGYGTFTPLTAIRLMDRPVAMGSNLHNALFAPADGRIWVANASADGQPAATQPYHHFRLPSLLESQPDTSAPELTGPGVRAAAR